MPAGHAGILSQAPCTGSSPDTFKSSTSGWAAACSPIAGLWKGSGRNFPQTSSAAEGPASWRLSGVGDRLGSGLPRQARPRLARHDSRLFRTASCVRHRGRRDPSGDAGCVRLGQDPLRALRAIQPTGDCRPDSRRLTSYCVSFPGCHPFHD